MDLGSVFGSFDIKQIKTSAVIRANLLLCYSQSLKHSFLYESVSKQNVKVTIKTSEWSLKPPLKENKNKKRREI